MPTFPKGNDFIFEMVNFAIRLDFIKSIFPKRESFLDCLLIFCELSVSE